MDLNMQSCGLDMWEAVCDAVWETPLEWDTLLPEGNPDMARLLCAQAVPWLSSWNVSANQLTVQGNVQVTALYLDDDGILCQGAFKLPVSKTTELPMNVSSPVCRIDLSVEYFHCRVVNPRRLDMRGSMSVSAGIWQQQEQPVLTDGSGVELRRRQVSACKLLPTAFCGYDMNEELELGYGKPLAQSVLHVGAQVVVMDKKAVNGKLVVKGELCVNVLYRPQEPEKSVETMEYALPFTHVADVPGLDEGWACDVRYSVAGIAVKPSGRQDAYGSRLSLTAALTANVDGYLPVTAEIVSDAYSTACETLLTEKRLPLLTPLGMVSETFSLKETLDCPAVREVLYLWLNPGAVQCRMEAGSAVISMKAEACLLGKDENGGILYHQQPWELQQTIPFSQVRPQMLFRPSVVLDNPGYALGSGEGVLRASLRVEGFLFGVENTAALSELTVVSEKPKAAVKDVIYLYYADGSRSVWEIAKGHNAPCGMVLEENQLESPDYRPNGLMVIPSGI